MKNEETSYRAQSDDANLDKQDEMLTKHTSKNK